ncbi:TcpQ domain-containing protein [Rahnella sikkimica]|uniref:Conjugal transfer protein n=1 Tax=Rahnella sikkimica TaxID=1805933 RepID=A0A2L1UZ72_9GAMM|nr:TcpQ domain-containing protein [Rahnella sikkimica]AVF38194.1 conjugal transfer protein [Rahnella sikkimica]
MSFTERAGLFPVLLLTGCASPATVTGPPSGSVVDGYLTRSAADISAMQYRLHQSGPSAQRPVSPSAAKPLTPLLSRPALFPAPSIKPSVVSVTPPSSGAGPADGFVRLGGAAPTLRSALRKIVPPGHTLVFDKTVFPDSPELWQWSGNDRWVNVANKLLATRGLKATINEAGHTVAVEPIQSAQSAKITGKVVGTPMLVGPVKPADLDPHNRNPFRGASSPQVNGGVVKPGSFVQVRTPAPAMKVWKIDKGSTLRQGFMLWATQENCRPEKGKWTVRWDTGTDYPVDFPLNFTASNFEDATAQLFILWRHAQVPLFVNGYRQQCLIVISDGK